MGLHAWTIHPNQGRGTFAGKDVYLICARCGLLHVEFADSAFTLPPRDGCAGQISDLIANEIAQAEQDRRAAMADAAARC